METKFSFCQRSPTIPATANDRNDHNHWDRIVNDCQRSQKVNGNDQCSNCSHRNDPSDHMETIAQRSQRRVATIVTITAIVCVLRLNDPSDYMEIKLQQ